MGKPCFWSTEEKWNSQLGNRFLISSNLFQRELQLPTLEELFREIQVFKFASCINLKMGYLLLPVCKETKKLLPFVMIAGMYECLVLVMGP